MAFSVTNTEVNGNVADADRINTNYTDIENEFNGPIRNKQTQGDHYFFSATGSDVYKQYIQIFEATIDSSPDVRLYLYGEVFGAPGEKTHAHTVASHTHTYQRGTFTTEASGAATPATDSIGVAATAVPQAVTISIDGVEKTATIGDPNTKGATMYDSVNDDWGVDGTTIWNTGELNLSALITWSVGEHFIEFTETGGTGGLLRWLIYTNAYN